MKKTLNLISLKRTLRDYFEVIFFALLLALFIRIFFLSVYRIPTASMEPNLLVGDFIFSYKWSYGYQWKFWQGQDYVPKNLQRGDLVVLHCPGLGREKFYCIKRVIGLPGDSLEIQKQRVVLNGQPLDYKASSEDKGFYWESLGERQWQVQFGELETTSQTVSYKKLQGVFVLGDHRDQSVDSRQWGEVDPSQVIEKVGFIWLSLDWERPVMGRVLPSLRPERLFMSVQ